MSAARIEPTSAISYPPPVATGECSICTNKGLPLYRVHDRSYGEVYDSAKHGPLQVVSGRLGFEISTTAEEIVDEGGTEKTVTIAKKIFQQVGTDPAADHRPRIFTDDHASCADCIRMMSAARPLKCPFCRIDIDKSTISLRPEPQAAAASRSSASRAAQSLRSNGRTYREAAASPASPPMEPSRASRPPRHATAASQGQRLLDEDEELEALVSASGARPGRHRPADRHSRQTSRHARSNSIFQRMIGDSEQSGEEAIGASREASSQRKVNYSGMDPASVQLIKELMRQDGLSNRQLLEMQRNALLRAGRLPAAGSSAGEYLDHDRREFLPEGGNHRPSMSRSDPAMMGSETVAASAAAASHPLPLLIPELSLALTSHPFITSLMTGDLGASAILDEAFASSLIANEEKVRLLLTQGIPLTVIHECRNWIFSQYFTVNPSEAILSQMNISERYETRSPLAKLYKQAVTYARFATLGQASDKSRLEEEITETLSRLSEDDRNLVEEWIWRENGEILTIDPIWGRNNTFRNPTALYSAIYKAIHMKLFTLSTAERIALISRCEGVTTNICKLADSFI